MARFTSPKAQRLDQFLVTVLKQSRKRVKQLIDAGLVYLGKRRIIIASWELAEGDIVEVRDPSQAAPPRRERYLKIHYEDEDLIVVEKPPGVACSPSPQNLTSTLVDDLNDYLVRAHPDRGHPYVGLMHRLDRDTSGLMVYTLKHRANSLSLQFKSHRLERHYLALVEGALRAPQGRIDSALQKGMLQKGPRVRVVERGGKSALTEFMVQERYPQVTLVQVRLRTGRTHQIRAHFASLGHALVGDRHYGARTAAARVMLHSAYLQFLHPVTGKKMTFQSPPPRDFREVLERFRKEGLRI